ncbi:MAG: cation transporter [Anaerolineae bacterium]|nr:cation transporter [Anaerolineae bacterium]
MRPHQSKNIEKRFILSLSLTGLILIGEVIGGLWTGSLALLSDAAHVFMDIFALALSFLALRLSAQPPDDRHTYGWHRLEVLAALTNGVTLILIALGIWYEAYQRWLEPTQVLGLEMLGIAVIGLIVNIIVAFILRGQDILHDDHHAHESHNGHKDINLQSAFLHVVGDAISSVGVIAAGFIIWQTGWYWVDPLASALIGSLILFNATRLTRSALHILIEGTPAGLSLQNVTNEITMAPAISSVHDLHVWSICSGHIALSAHVVLEEGYVHSSDSIMADLKDRLRTRFGIEHTTIQFENAPCLQHADCNGC